MKTRHEELMENPEFRKLLAVEALVAEAAEEISRLMGERKISKADLARRLGKSRAWVTQLLSGQANVTVRTLAEVVHALDGEVAIQVHAPGRKSVAKPVGTAGRPVAFKMNRTWLDPRGTGERIFQLRSEQLNSSKEELAPVRPGEDPIIPEYAA